MAIETEWVVYREITIGPNHNYIAVLQQNPQVEVAGNHIWEVVRAAAKHPLYGRIPGRQFKVVPPSDEQIKNRLLSKNVGAAFFNPFDARLTMMEKFQLKYHTALNPHENWRPAHLQPHTYSS